MQLAVFASGGGTNFQSILDAIEMDQLPAQPVLCISDRPEAGALTRAQRHDVPTTVIDPNTFNAPETFARAILERLKAHNTTFIALAGYLKKIPPSVIDAYENRILNIHPALLPAFGGKGMYGMRVHQAVIDYGVRWTGVTIHIVTEKYDAGPVVLQKPVPVRQDDTPESLAERVLKMEHELYPEALRLFAEDRIAVEGRRVRILGTDKDEPLPPRENHRSSA